MISIDQLTVTVSVEGDAAPGEDSFARLFDRYMRLWEQRSRSERTHAAQVARDRRIGTGGGR